MEVYFTKSVPDGTVYGDPIWSIFSHFVTDFIPIWSNLSHLVRFWLTFRHRGRLIWLASGCSIWLKSRYTYGMCLVHVFVPHLVCVWCTFLLPNELLISL